MIKVWRSEEMPLRQEGFEETSSTQGPSTAAVHCATNLADSKLVRVTAAIEVTVNTPPGRSNYFSVKHQDVQDKTTFHRRLCLPPILSNNLKYCLRGCSKEKLAAIYKFWIFLIIFPSSSMLLQDLTNLPRTIQGKQRLPTWPFGFRLSWFLSSQP